MLINKKVKNDTNDTGKELMVTKSHKHLVQDSVIDESLNEEISSNEQLISIRTNEIYIAPKSPISFIDRKIESVKEGALIERNQQFPKHDEYGRPLIEIKDCIVTDCCTKYLHKDSAKACEICGDLLCKEHRILQQSGKYRCENCDESTRLIRIVKEVSKGIFGKNIDFFKF